MNEKYRQELIRRIKDIGQEIIDRAEEIATGDMMTDLRIYINLDMTTAKIDTLEWSTEVVIKNQYERLIGNR